MYSYHSNLLPLTFINSFTFNYAIHNHKTRISKNLHLSLFKYNFSRTTVKFTGAKNWNEMPSKIKNSKTLNQFRRLYKDYLLKIESNHVGKSCLPVPFFSSSCLLHCVCPYVFMFCLLNVYDKLNAIFLGDWPLIGSTAFADSSAYSFHCFCVCTCVLFFAFLHRYFCYNLMLLYFECLLPLVILFVKN